MLLQKLVHGLLRLTLRELCTRNLEFASDANRIAPCLLNHNPWLTLIEFFLPHLIFDFFRTFT